MLFAWCLLHAGYARFYAGLYDEAPDPPPPDFPHSGHPTTVDFFYFSFTLGNAVVLALAVGILTRR
jgi:uncharacterized membrane protein